MRLSRRAAALTVLILLVTAAGVGQPAPRAAAQAGDWPGVPGTVLVTAATPARSVTLATVLPEVVRPTRPFGVRADRIGEQVVRVRVPVGGERAAAAAMAAVPGVLAAEPDLLLAPVARPADPFYVRQWPHIQTGIESAWDVRTDARPAVVAVLDTGMNGTHPDLAPSIVGQVDASRGSVTGAPATEIDNDTCQQGHGTYVGGILGAVGDNGEGIAGTGWRSAVLDVAVTSQAVNCVISSSAVIAGLDYVSGDEGGPVAVANLSLGAFQDTCPTALQQSIDRANAAGVLVVAAAGNGEQDASTAGRTSVPAGCDGVISVGATAVDRTRAGYSTQNDSVDLAAPGGDAEDGTDGLVPTTNAALANGLYRYVQGTSFAAPYVAGVAALARSQDPRLSPAQVTGLLEETAEDLGPSGRDDAFGAGLVRPDRALAALAAGDVPPPAAPAPEPEPAPAPEPEPAPTPTADPTPEPTPAPDPTEDPSPAPPPDEGLDPPEQDQLPAVTRVAAGTLRTEPVAQAVAISREAFPEAAATHAVLARADVFADALAGSTLGAGRGPLLYALPDGPLPEETRGELQRTLLPGATVYLLGGAVALPATLEEEIAALGFRPHRLAGGAREETAAAIAEEVRRLLPVLGEPLPTAVALARRDTWPDSVVAGSLGAEFGIPLLVTATEELHPAAEAVLASLRPATVYVIGGTAAVSDATAAEAAAVAGGTAVRLGGAARDVTAVQVATEHDRLLDVEGSRAPRYALAVNIRRDDGYAHVLSATAAAAVLNGVFVPVEQADGTVLPEVARTFLEGRWEAPAYGLLVGGEDLVAPTIADDLAAALAG